jgi:hypothetical protein
MKTLEERIRELEQRIPCSVDGCLRNAKRKCDKCNKWYCEDMHILQSKNVFLCVNCEEEEMA